MMSDKENDDIWSLGDDKCSLKFIFDWSIRMKKFL